MASEYVPILSHIQFFPGVSHNIHMERPELVNESVDSWLRRRKLDSSAIAAGEAEEDK